jgi:hypothetical protein
MNILNVMKGEKRIVLSGIFLLTAITVVAQGGAKTFGEASLAANNTGMYILGGWALANMAAGAYGWATFEGERKYFSQMNLFWNVVNLSIAGIALYSLYSTDLITAGTEEILAKHLKTEKLFLINSGLDVGYMGAGFLMRHLSGRAEKRADLLRGYGNAVILQGGFLLVFDMAMYFIFNDIRPGNIEPVSMMLNQEVITAGIRITF